MDWLALLFGAETAAALRKLLGGLEQVDQGLKELDAAEEKKKGSPLVTVIVIIAAILFFIFVCAPAMGIHLLW